MGIDICEPGDLAAADLAAWAALQERAAREGAGQLANPFLSPEFTLAVGRVRRGVRVAVIREQGGREGAFEGFFPYQRSAFGVGRAVGLGLSDCQGVVHRPGFTCDARELLRACGLAVWEFDHLAAGPQPFARFASSAHASPVIDVAGGPRAFWDGLRERSPGFTRRTLSKERKLGREAGEVVYVHDERDPRVLRTLLAWKSAQYRRTGRSDRFARPWIVELVERLFHTSAGSCAGRLSVLYAGGRPVAAHFGLRSRTTLATWFPAYDPAFARYSPGLVLHLRLAEAAAAEGLRHVDMGRGDKRYKDALKSGDLTVYEGWAARRHPVALGHRARRAPVRALRHLVVSRPELFAPADRLLKRWGAMRSGGERTTRG
ncbi:GNAT family N-acetyltransferase [Streptomyces sp. TRM 70351]|uniref:GNAT family N-acetyltransferase n=1 Tax=Streptomyces sp. TRM 70351 TaxID=3116552 RepID=UPI002E7BDD09|nr:GNAT family N-acetyltransferase [Streptomyces sp. TRM 70351]MEE1929245.1 GNAT family N-acetyltransferase [Streptomyces sp. TRM 70351]